MIVYAYRCLNLEQAINYTRLKFVLLEENFQAPIVPTIKPDENFIG